MKKIIVIGIGNPYLRDDRISLSVVKDLELFFKDHKNIFFEVFYSSGIELLDSILDYDCAVFIDSFISKDIGKVFCLTIEDILHLPETSSPHSTNLTTMIKLGMKISPDRMPNKIFIFAIGIKDPFTFSEKFSSGLELLYDNIFEEIKSKIKEVST